MSHLDIPLIISSFIVSIIIVFFTYKLLLKSVLLSKAKPFTDTIKWNTNFNGIWSIRRKGGPIKNPIAYLKIRNGFPVILRKPNDKIYDWHSIDNIKITKNTISFNRKDNNNDIYCREKIHDNRLLLKRIRNGMIDNLAVKNFRFNKKKKASENIRVFVDGNIVFSVNNMPKSLRAVPTEVSQLVFSSKNNLLAPTSANDNHISLWDMNIPLSVKFTIPTESLPA